MHVYMCMNIYTCSFL